MRSNPYRLGPSPWSPELVEARAAMPKTVGGHIVDPAYLPRGAERRDLLARWREWSRRFPARNWPTWLEGALRDAAAEARP